MQDRVALVTGSSRGIGRAIALELARAEMDVVVTSARRKDAAAAVVAEIEALGVRSAAVELDVSSRESVRQTVDRVYAEFGLVDVLVNNAGILQQKAFETITDADWDEVLAANLRGACAFAQEVLPVMKRQGGGRIVNLSSSGGQLGEMLALLERNPGWLEINRHVSQKEVQ